MRDWTDFQVAVVAVLIALILLIFLLAYASDDTRARLHNTRAFIASQYNFSESECVSRIQDIVPDCTKPCWDMTEHGATVGEWNNCITQMNAYCTKCLLYCHTAQIPDSERCTKKVSNMVISEEGARCLQGEYGPIELNNEWFNGTYYGCIVETCTPTYRNVTTFCATPEQISKAQELIA